MNRARERKKRARKKRQADARQREPETVVVLENRPVLPVIPVKSEAS